MTILEVINIILETLGCACLSAACVYLIIDYILNMKRIFILIPRRAVEILLLIGCLFCPIMPLIAGYVVVIASTIGACWQITSIIKGK